jgi:hypothetical protein
MNDGQRHLATGGDVLNLYPGKLKNLSAWLGDLTIDSRDFH